MNQYDKYQYNGFNLVNVTSISREDFLMGRFTHDFSVFFENNKLSRNIIKRHNQ